MSTLTIVLLIVGGLGALGVIAIVGMFVLVAAVAADPDPAAASSSSSSSTSSTSGGAPTATATTTTPAPEDDSDPTPEPPTKPFAGSSTSSSASSGASSGGSTKPGGTKWFCNATGWVRVCGFANVCNNQMVSGIGSGYDQFSASMMAKNACEGMARAKGGSTVCTVACSVR